MSERFREQLLFRVEVVVDEAARDPEPLGNIGDAGRGETSLDHDLARDLEDLGAPFFDGELLHRLTTL